MVELCAEVQVVICNKSILDTMLSASSSIDKIGLGTKERRALSMLGVKTVGEFLRIDLKKVLSLRGFGAGKIAKEKWIRASLNPKPFRFLVPCGALSGALDLAFTKRTLSLNGKGDALRSDKDRQRSRDVSLYKSRGLA